MLKHLRIAVMALCITPFGVQAVDCPEFSQSQIAVLKKAHAYGSHNMGGNWGVVLAAISYQESSAGKEPHGKGSYGVFQNKLTTVTKRTGDKASVAKKKLLSDFDYSAEQAKKELDYWSERYYIKTHREDNLTKVLSSYNAGYHPSAGKTYAKDVKQKMKIINECVLTKQD